jgi:hypothetical protein
MEIKIGHTYEVLYDNGFHFIGKLIKILNSNMPFILPYTMQIQSIYRDSPSGYGWRWDYHHSGEDCSGDINNPLGFWHVRQEHIVKELYGYQLELDL